VLSAGRGRPAGTPFGLLVRALPDLPSECGASCLWRVGPRICGRVGGTRDMPVEALFPQGRKHFELGSSGWSWILGIDAVGGPPHCDFANEGAGVSSRWCPDWLGVTLAGVVFGSGRRGRRPAGIALSGRAPSPDGYGGFLECPGAKAADLARQVPALGARNPASLETFQDLLLLAETCCD
jgi:hypothetical protein